MMRHMLILLVMLAVLSVSQTSKAAGDLSRRSPTTVEVQLGTKDDRHVFRPDHLTFETGKLYRLVLANPSPSTHDFTSEEFVASVWTRKVQDSAMEVKGAIQEVEVFPGAVVEWWFVPVRTGTFRLICEEANHDEMGMVGKITIK